MTSVAPAAAIAASAPARRPVLHVITTKEAVDPGRLPGKVVVVLDVLFATTTIVTALAEGATAVIPVDGEAAARARAATLAPDRCVLAGEQDAITLPGFVDPTPLALLRHGVAGRTLVYATTNGTVALQRCEPAAAVYAGALVNIGAVARQLLAHHAQQTVLLVCAGSAGRFNIEDFHGAGALVARLQSQGAWQLSDAAQAAALTFGAQPSAAALAGGRLGRRLIERGWADEVSAATRVDAYDVVPQLAEGVLRLTRGRH